MSDPDISHQLEGPLALLKSIAERVFVEGKVPAQGQLADLQSAVSDVLDVAARSLVDLMEQVEDELAPSEYGLESAREELKAITEDLEDQLGALSDALLGANTFEELGAAFEEVEAVELAMQSTLGRLGLLLDRLVDGQLEEDLQVSYGTRSEEASEVLELLAVALGSVDGHLANGDLGYLRNALQHVDRAAEILRLALARGEEDAVMMALARAENDHETEIEHEYDYDNQYGYQHQDHVEDEEV